MEFSLVSLVFVTTVVAFLFNYFSRKKSKYPPGPVGIPYFGSFFSVGPAPHLKFSEWAKKYGPVFSVKIGGIEAVVLNDTKSIREAFKEDAFTGRPGNKLFNQLGGGGKDGVGFADGQIWSEQRRFVLRGLRDFGFGKNTMESIITEEVDEFVEWMARESGHPISLNRRFSLAVVNSIWMISCGKRYKHDDPKLTELSNASAEALNQAVESGYLVFLHELAAIAPELTGWNKFVKIMESIGNIMKNEIREHEQTFVAENPPRDFLDTYLANIKSTKDPRSSFFQEMGYVQLKAVLMDFFGAGSETSASTLTWAILYLTANPTAQKKIQEELDREIGKNRRPVLADKPKLPYTEACTNEVIRMSSIIPSGLFHSTMSNVTFQGFEIPKDTCIISNLYGVHHDPNVWEKPEEFRPERFLSQDGKTVLKSENLLAFSVGKRACIGESLARDTVFLFLTSILQRFEISFDRPAREVSLEPVLGFVLQAPKFHVILKDRLAQ